MMEYKIVTVEGGTFSGPMEAINKQEVEVNNLIEQGWKPLGSVHVITLPANIVVQAMVKEAPDN